MSFTTFSSMSQPVTSCRAGQRLRGRSATSLQVAHSSRRDLLFAGFVAANSSNAATASQAAATPARPKPFCSVVDRVPFWAYSTPWQEDVVEFAGGKTWYRWVNNVAPQGSGGLLSSIKGSSAADNKLPVLVISGGPGLPVSYLESLELMAGVGRPVIFYDQVGIGNTFLASNSTCPPVDHLTLDLYMQQIDALRNSLQLAKCHLYAQGVGGMLALSYAASQHGKQGGICSVTVTAMPSSYKQLIADRLIALQQLGGSTQELLLAADAAAATGRSNTISSTAIADVVAARQRYNQQYICRSSGAVAAAPLGCVRAAMQQRSRPVFVALAGRQYFAAAGDLVEWDVSTLKAAETMQDLPVLVSCGDGDEVSHKSAQQLVDNLPKAVLAVHAGSGSYVHIDAWEPHLTKVEEHLCLSEGSPLPVTV